jgi:hypothetical protein
VCVCPCLGVVSSGPYPSSPEPQPHTPSLTTASLLSDFKLVVGAIDSPVSLLRQLDIVALGALCRAGLLACLRSPASKSDTLPLTTVSLLSDFKAGPLSRSSSCPPVCPDQPRHLQLAAAVADFDTCTPGALLRHYLLAHLYRRVLGIGGALRGPRWMSA